MNSKSSLVLQMQAKLREHLEAGETERAKWLQAELVRVLQKQMPSKKEIERIRLEFRLDAFNPALRHAMVEAGILVEAAPAPLPEPSRTEPPAPIVKLPPPAPLKTSAPMPQLPAHAIVAVPAHPKWYQQTYLRFCVHCDREMQNVAGRWSCSCQMEMGGEQC